MKEKVHGNEAMAVIEAAEELEGVIRAYIAGRPALHKVGVTVLGYATEMLLGDAAPLVGREWQALSDEYVTLLRHAQRDLQHADGYMTANPRNLKPVLLTPEILLKNGFVNDFYEDVSVADYHTVRVEGYTYNGKKEVEGWDDCLITCCNGHVDVVTDFHGEVRKDVFDGFDTVYEGGINLIIKD